MMVRYAVHNPTLEDLPVTKREDLEAKIKKLENENEKLKEENKHLDYIVSQLKVNLESSSNKHIERQELIRNLQNNNDFLTSQLNAFADLRSAVKKISSLSKKIK